MDPTTQLKAALVWKEATILELAKNKVVVHGNCHSRLKGNCSSGRGLAS